MNTYFFLILFFRLARAEEEINLYTTYNETLKERKCLDSEPLSSCGTVDKPFSSILQTFFFIDSNSRSFAAYTRINIFLVYDYYIFDGSSVNLYLSQLNTMNEESEIVWKFLSKLSEISITIQPLYASSNVFFAIKTSNFIFYLNNINLLLSNIHFDGIDLTLNSYFWFRNPDEGCVYWKLACCYIEIIKELGFCEPYEGLNLVQIKRIDFITLYSKKNNLIIQSCKFENFDFLRINIGSYVGSFISDYSIQSYIKVTNSVFSNFELTDFFIKNQISIETFNFMAALGEFYWVNNTCNSFFIKDVISAGTKSIFYLYFYSFANIINSSFVNIGSLCLFSLLSQVVIFNCQAEENRTWDLIQESYISINAYDMNISNTIIKGKFSHQRMFNFTGNLLIKNISLEYIELKNYGYFFIYGERNSELIIEDLNVHLSEIQFERQEFFVIQNFGLLSMTKIKLRNSSKKKLYIFSISKIMV